MYIYIYIYIYSLNNEYWEKSQLSQLVSIFRQFSREFCDVSKFTK